jgi:hypothetical protein
MEHLQKTIWPKHTRLVTLASMGFTLVVLKGLQQFVAPRLGEVKRYFLFGSGFDPIPGVWQRPNSVKNT